MIKNIWSRPKYLPYVQPELNDALIKTAEEKMGVTLPIEYLDLLKVQNGGYIRCSFNETPHDVIKGIGPHYPSITNFEWLSEYEDLSYDINGLFPFDGDGHWNLCLDYRSNKEFPKITYIDTESDYDRVVAQSFQEYLDQLTLRYDYDYLIITDLETVELIEKISNCIDITFKEPNSEHYGYPVHAGKYKMTWIQVIPNEVPLGFVRENHPRYNELKSQMNEFTLKYPEIPRKNHYLNFNSEDNKIEILEKLIEAGLSILKFDESLI